MVAHQAPGENLPAIEIADTTSRIYKLGGFVDAVKYEFAACDTTIHVVRGSGQKQPRLSRHGITPMRGRDAVILRHDADNATMRYVAPMRKNPRSGERGLRKGEVPTIGGRV